MIFQLLYASGVSDLFVADDIASILETSRRRNAENGISGLLLYCDGVFIQFLEGKRDTVQELSKRIGRDPRHRNMMVMLERDAEERAFAAWSMGFRTLDKNVPAEADAFRLSRDAVSGRMRGAEADLIMETIFAFAGEGVR